MGRFGSGRYRWATRPTWDDLRRVEIQTLHRQGALQPGQCAIITWGRSDRLTVVVSYAMPGDELVLTYLDGDGHEAGQPVRQTITLAYTLCHYGGSRPWFLCPQCARRVAVLARRGRRWACRRCCRLPYASERGTLVDRSYRKLRKIRAKVGASPNLMVPIRDKPKGMHWRTFERLRQQERAAHLQVLHHLAALLPWVRAE